MTTTTAPTAPDTMGDTMTDTTTTAPAVITMTTAPTAPWEHAAGVVTLTRGAVIAVRWAGRGGVRGSAAYHTTETVVGVTTDDGRTGTLTLTGGQYRDGAATRTLATHRADGRPSSQIITAWHGGAVVAALAAVMGAATMTPATIGADDDAARRDDDGAADDAATMGAADDGAAVANNGAAMLAANNGATIVGGATIVAAMVGASSTGDRAWEREDWRRRLKRDGVAARRGHARWKRATRRTHKRGERRDAMASAWADAADAGARTTRR